MKKPLCITLLIMVTRYFASCWLQAKLTWMQRTSAHLHFDFITDFLSYFVFWTLPLIFCSRDQRTALHLAANHRHHLEIGVCELLIAGTADVNAKDRCAFVFWICHWFCVVFCCWTLLLSLCSSDQKTALHYAAGNGQPELCELLIASKADVNAKDGCAFTFKICILFCVVFCCWALLLNVLF